jgi:RNA polymerase sigma-70 factor (ECF subfamily)
VLLEDHPDLRAAVDSLVSAGANPEAELEREQRARYIQVALDRLPPRYGDALEWKYIEGHSVEEIGQRLGIGHTAAQSLLARARVAFRDGLEAVFGASASDVLAHLEA